MNNGWIIQNLKHMYNNYNIQGQKKKQINKKKNKYIYNKNKEQRLEYNFPFKTEFAL